VLESQGLIRSTEINDEGAAANIHPCQKGVGSSPTSGTRWLSVKLNNNDTSILDHTAILESVWSAFVKVAAEFPDDEGVVITLRYQRWYSSQCTVLSRRPESPATRSM
jgi:hypothetical protein